MGVLAVRIERSASVTQRAQTDAAQYVFALVSRADTHPFQPFVVEEDWPSCGFAREGGRREHARRTLKFYEKAI